MATEIRSTLRAEAAPVREPTRPILFLNPLSGGGTPLRTRLAERARERGISVVEFGPRRDLAKAVDEAIEDGFDFLGVAGGDGSLAPVADAASIHDLPFVCIPAGTRNHFARDLGLDPGDPVRALDAFSDGVERRIDIGEVNGRPFLNLVSIGIYGEAVRRPTYRDAKLRTLFETMLETSPTALGSGAPLPELDLVDDRGQTHPRSAALLVSNNPYHLTVRARRGSRPALDGGALGIIAIDAPGSHRHPPARAWTATGLEVGVRADGPGSAPLNTGLDGEAVALRPPLRFGIRRRALRVRLPKDQARPAR